MNDSIDISNQTGAALMVSLIMLLVMTLIIVSGARSSALEIMLADNAQNAQQALMRAEDSALTGEERINLDYSGAPTFDFGLGDDGLYVDGQLALETVDWHAIEAEREGAGENLREYIIEYLGPAAAVGGSLSIGAGSASDPRYLYRVSGRGAANRGSARVVQVIMATAE
jgi:type IV pilus assembly protein PilX